MYTYSRLQYISPYGMYTVPDKEKRVDGEGGVADRLEHKVPLGDSAQDLVLCKVHMRQKRKAASLASYQ